MLDGLSLYTGDKAKFQITDVVARDLIQSEWKRIGSVTIDDEEAGNTNKQMIAEFKSMLLKYANDR